MANSLPGTPKMQGTAMIIVVIAVVILAFIIVNKVFGGFSALFSGIGSAAKGATDTLGITKTDAELAIEKRIEEAAAKVAESGSPWNPNFYKNIPGNVTFTLLTNAKTQELADQLWASVSYVLPDTPSQGLAAIKQVPTKAAMSYLVDIFGTKYKRDLFQWLKEWYNLPYQQEYLAQIISYVNTLPTYKRA